MKILNKKLPLEFLKIILIIMIIIVRIFVLFPL